MADKKTLLEKRKEIKKTKPNFRRKDTTKKPRLSTQWRRGRGLQNKQRMNRKSHVKNPESGYRSPIEIRGCHKSGLKPVLVSNIPQLELLSKENGIIISSNVGLRKKKELVEAVNKKGLRILNLNAEKVLKDIDTQLKARKQERKERLEKKKEKKAAEEKARKAEKKKEEEKEKTKTEDKEEDFSEEEKKKLEKQEKDKVLIKKS